MKKALIFLGGLASGFGLGCIFSKLRSTKSEEVKSDNKVLEVIEFDPDKDRKKAPIEKKPDLDELVERYKVNDQEEENPYPPEDYLPPEDDEPEEEEDDEDPPEVEFSFPQIIPRLEFENEKKNYEVQTLTYYTYDDTVCDENEQVISSPEDLIGDDALVCFGLGSDDPNTVYICNDKRGTKYEVIKVNGSYQEQVLGITENNSYGTRKMRREDSDSD